MPDSSREVTELLQAWRSGDASALDRLIPLLYEDLRRIARRKMAHERRVTLQPTALAHETYRRLIGQSRVPWQDRAHFLAVAARTMKRLLVEQARRRNALKRGGPAVTLTWSAAESVAEPLNVDVVALDDALRELRELSPRQAEVVELRFFGGLTVRETAAALGVSPATVKLDWKMAKAWLLVALEAK